VHGAQLAQVLTRPPGIPLKGGSQSVTTTLLVDDRFSPTFWVHHSVASTTTWR